MKTVWYTDRIDQLILHTQDERAHEVGLTIDVQMPLLRAESASVANREIDYNESGERADPEGAQVQVKAKVQHSEAWLEVGREGQI